TGVPGPARRRASRPGPAGTGSGSSTTAASGAAPPPEVDPARPPVLLPSWPPPVKGVDPNPRSRSTRGVGAGGPTGIGGRPRHIPRPRGSTLGGKRETLFQQVSYENCAVVLLPLPPPRRMRRRPRSPLPGPPGEARGHLQRRSGPPDQGGPLRLRPPRKDQVGGRRRAAVGRPGGVAEE